MLAFAVPDHPWTDSADGAAVRVAMTVGVRADRFDAEAGRLAIVTRETTGDAGQADVTLDEATGRIHADLTQGADVTSAEPLDANAGLSSFGVLLAGRGFVLLPDEAVALGRGRGHDAVIRPLLNGRDLTTPARERYVVDFYGLTADEARERHPEAYEHLLRTVKPERDQSRNTTARQNWWLYDRSRPALRAALAGLSRYVATPETARHRLFQFLPVETLPEHGIIAIGTADAFHLGVLSSRVHVEWALAAGGRLGVGNDPRYNSSRTFEPFPFPPATDEQAASIRTLGEAVDAHRKDRQAADPSLGLTDLYNAVEALRAGRDLTPKEAASAEAGLARTLLDLHRRLDRAVLDAYGWGDLDADGPGFAPAVLARLVALNAERRAEEAAGTVRYLRPSFQAPATTQAGLVLPTATRAAQAPVSPSVRPWPDALSGRTVAVRQAVAGGAHTAEDVAARFVGARPADVADVLDTLAALGLVRADGRTFTV